MYKGGLSDSGHADMCVVHDTRGTRRVQRFIPYLAVRFLFRCARYRRPAANATAPRGTPTAAPTGSPLFLYTCMGMHTDQHLQSVKIHAAIVRGHT